MGKILFLFYTMLETPLNYDPQIQDERGIFKIIGTSLVDTSHQRHRLYWAVDSYLLEFWLSLLGDQTIIHNKA